MKISVCIDMMFSSLNFDARIGAAQSAGLDTVELAEKYGTPLYLMDENKIRERVRIYKKCSQIYHLQYIDKGLCLL